MACDNTTPSHDTAVCPVNGQAYRNVSYKTLLHHVRSPRNQELPAQSYYFCSSPDCDVVYFGKDGTVFTRSDVREQIGQKQVGAERTLCYCFDIKEDRVYGEIGAHGYSPSFVFVVEQTRIGNCACEVRNASGRCCLGNFPKKAAKKRTTAQ